MRETIALQPSPTLQHGPYKPQPCSPVPSRPPVPALPPAAAVWSDLYLHCSPVPSRPPSSMIQQEPRGRPPSTPEEAVIAAVSDDGHRSGSAIAGAVSFSCHTAWSPGQRWRRIHLQTLQLQPLNKPRSDILVEVEQESNLPEWCGTEQWCLRSLMWSGT